MPSRYSLAALLTAALLLLTACPPSQPSTYTVLQVAPQPSPTRHVVAVDAEP